MNDSNSPLEGKQFLNVHELAGLLRVSRTSIYRLIERRLITFHRLPRGLRFDREDIEAYLKKCRVESREKTMYERSEDKKILVG